MGNSFGEIFRLTTFGESHGVGIGGIIDGCPAGLVINLDAIQKELDRRKPGQSKITTARKEDDIVIFQSGIFEGKTTGTPIGFYIANKDHRSADYSEIKKSYRPSHADFVYDQKYGFRDYRGGGRSSARETACRVVAGAIAKQVLALKNIRIAAFVKAVGTIFIPHEVLFNNIASSEVNAVRCPDRGVAKEMEEAILKASQEGDSLGGIVQCVITGVNPGLGEPVFDKFHAVLAHGMMSINAVKGFEIGSGFLGCTQPGSAQNDAFTLENGDVKTETNNSGGIQGGITNGAEVRCNIGFKPVATIAKEQNTVTNTRNEVVLAAKGRHDPCVVPRAIPIVESMAAIVTLDFLLRSRINRIDQL